MAKITHSPLPWTHDEISLNNSLVPYLRSGDKILASLCLTDGKTPAIKLQDEAAANADIICDAVNNYALLKEENERLKKENNQLSQRINEHTENAKDQPSPL